jgi:hypothetical protein
MCLNTYVSLKQQERQVSFMMLKPEHTQDVILQFSSENVIISPVRTSQNTEYQDL